LQVTDFGEAATLTLQTIAGDVSHIKMVMDQMERKLDSVLAGAEAHAKGPKCRKPAKGAVKTVVVNIP